MTTAQKGIKTKVGLLELAKQLGNVADARRPNHKNRVEARIEDAVVATAIDQPAWGQLRVSNELWPPRASSILAPQAAASGRPKYPSESGSRLRGTRHPARPHPDRPRHGILRSPRPPSARALPGGQRHRTQADEDQAPPDERDLRALPEDRAPRVLPGRPAADALSGPGRAAARSRSVDEGIQRGASASGPLVLRQDPDADVSGQRAVTSCFRVFVAPAAEE